MVGVSLSTIQGKGINVYVALVIHERVSNEEILELITAPSSVVFLLNTILSPARVVNSSIVLKIFCVVLNQNVAACNVAVLDHEGLTQYDLYRYPLLIYHVVEVVKNGLIDI